MYASFLRYFGHFISDNMANCMANGNYTDDNIYNITSYMVAG